MKIIADSGSTKTEWNLLLPDGTIQALYSTGLNPFFISSGKVTEIVQQTFSKINTELLKEVYFYGAGCSSLERCTIISSGLEHAFPKAEIKVEHDMLAAARALFGNKEGIAIILGTGSNSCVYDGKDITGNIPALGYILGDEGSGAFFGLQLIKDFLNNEMPETLVKKFKEQFLLDKEDILNAVYKQPFPNRYLAQFFPFCTKNQETGYIRQLIFNGFNLFFRRHILPYPDYQEYPLGCVGSVGFYLQDILQAVAKKYHLSILTIEKSPIKGLIEYHKKKPHQN